jgi:hypothetical protein
MTDKKPLDKHTSAGLREKMVSDQNKKTSLPVKLGGAAILAVAGVYAWNQLEFGDWSNPTPRYTHQITDPDGMEVYNGPSTAFNVVTRLATGTCVEVVGNSYPPLFKVENTGVETSTQSAGQYIRSDYNRLRRLTKSGPDCPSL